MAEIKDLINLITSHQARQDAKEARQQQMSLDIMKMDFAKEARQDQQDFEIKKMKDAIELNLHAEHPGALFNRETNTFDYSNVDWSKSKSAQIATAATTSEQLREAQLDYDGTDDENALRLGVYNRAKLHGTSMMQPSISPSISMQLGDRTPGMYTEHDIIDYEGWFEGSGGVHSPIALNELVESGVIDDNILTRNNLGMYTGGDTDVEVEKTSELIKVAFAGLKVGSRANESYKSVAAFEMQTEAERAKNMQFAADLTNNAAVNQTIQTFDSIKRGIGGTILSVMVDPATYKQSALWHGEREHLIDIYDEIKQVKGVFKDEGEKANFISFMKTVFSIGADGSNIETVLAMIKTDKRFLEILGSQQFNPALATSLSHAVDKWSDIVKISKLAGSFIEEPVDVGQISDFREYLQQSGLLYGFQKLRVMEAGNDPEAEEYHKEIEALTMKQYDMIRKTGDKKMLSDFQRWLDLEDATSGLFIDSLKKKGGI